MEEFDIVAGMNVIDDCMIDTSDSRLEDRKMPWKICHLSQASWGFGLRAEAFAEHSVDEDVYYAKHPKKKAK